MVENRTGEDETVGERDGDAEERPLERLRRHAAGGGAMEID